MTAQPLSLPAEAENELPAEAAAAPGRHHTLTVAVSDAPTASASGRSPSPADSATARFFASWLARNHPGTAWEVEIDASPLAVAAEAVEEGQAAA